MALITEPPITVEMAEGLRGALVIVFQTAPLLKPEMQ